MSFSSAVKFNSILRQHYIVGMTADRPLYTTDIRPVDCQWPHRRGREFLQAATTVAQFQHSWCRWKAPIVVDLGHTPSNLGENFHLVHVNICTPVPMNKPPSVIADWQALYRHSKSPHSSSLDQYAKWSGNYYYYYYGSAKAVVWHQLSCSFIALLVALYRSSQMTQCRLNHTFITTNHHKLNLFTIERDDFRCFRSKMCFRTLAQCICHWTALYFHYSTLICDDTGKRVYNLTEHPRRVIFFNGFFFMEYLLCRRFIIPIRQLPKCLSEGNVAKNGSNNTIQNGVDCVLVLWAPGKLPVTYIGYIYVFMSTYVCVNLYVFLSFIHCVYVLRVRFL